MKKLNLFLIVILAMFSTQIFATDMAKKDSPSNTTTVETKMDKMHAEKMKMMMAKDAWKKGMMINFDFFNRTRFKGVKADSNDWTDFFTQKTIFGMKAMKKGMGMAVFQLRNANILGVGYPNSHVGTDALSVYQAYGQFKLPFGVHSCLYFGRKEINIDTQYIFGAVGFSDLGKTFDTAGLKMVFMNKKLKLNIFHVRQFESSVGNTDEGLNTLHVRYNLNKMMGFSFLYINDRLSNGKTYMSHLLGLRANGKLDFGFNFNFEAYYQFGDNITIGSGNATAGSVSAYAVLLDLSYSLKNIAPKPTLGLLLNMNSGDDDTTDDTNKNFLVAMGTKHKWFGLMDIFMKPENWGAQGILDISPYVNWTCIFNKSVKFKFNYHYFMPLVKVDKNDKKSLGMEFDLTAKYAVNKMFSFIGDFGYFLPGDLQKDAGLKDKEIMAYGAFQVKF